MDVSLLQDTTGSSATRCRGDIRLLFLCVVGQRPHSAPLPRRRAGWALPLGAGTPRSALGGLGGALRQPQTRGPKAYPSGRASWLYNITAYRRLFPESYLATAHMV